MCTKLCKAYLGVGLVVALLGPDPPGRHVVADGLRQRREVVPRRRHIAVLPQRVVEVPVEALCSV